MSIMVAMGEWLTGQKRVLLSTGKKIPEDVVKIVYLWAGRELDIQMMNYKQSWGRGVIETGSELALVRRVLEYNESKIRLR